MGVFAGHQTTSRVASLSAALATAHHFWHTQDTANKGFFRSGAELSSRPAPPGCGPGRACQARLQAPIPACALGGCGGHLGLKRTGCQFVHGLRDVTWGRQSAKSTIEKTWFVKLTLELPVNDSCGHNDGSAPDSQISCRRGPTKVFHYDTVLERS